MYCFVSSENWLRSPTAVPVLNAVNQARILLRHSSRSSLVSVTLICEINSHGARDKTQINKFTVNTELNDCKTSNF